MIRPATLADLDALVGLEETCFETDRLTRRNFRHLLTRGHAATLVDETGGRLRGYVLVLFRRGISLARIYSVATDPQCRGEGLAAALVEAAERSAIDEGCVVMRSEIRKDNRASINLFEREGYRPFGEYAGYYEDAMDAVRYEKFLLHLDPSLTQVPYYPQTLEFTCGPACLMMAMKALRPETDLNRRLELRLWRESTTVFMTSGHGGCGPHGLALAAHARGFGAELFLKEAGPMFLDSVRNAEKKEVMRLVQEDFIEQVQMLEIPLHYGGAGVAELETRFKRGGIPIVLISSYRLYGEKAPHWVVVVGFDERFIYVSDPYVDVEEGKTTADYVNVPILREEFDRMARYGKSGQRAAVIINGSLSE